MDNIPFSGGWFPSSVLYFFKDCLIIVVYIALCIPFLVILSILFVFGFLYVLLFSVLLFVLKKIYIGVYLL